MNDELKTSAPPAGTSPSQPEGEDALQQDREDIQANEEAYGWEFHRFPLLIAAIVTVLFYAFVFFYVGYKY